ncbi:MAG: thioredoxin domain-containing protein, partial [Verrucomicrobiia bacterium]
DVDKIYMSFVQATTGGGGWPMSVFLTPEKNPFFGGTYFPKRDFMSLCSRVNELWNDAEKRPLIEKDALNMARGLAEASARKPDPNAKLNFGLLTNGLAQIKATYDPRFGGFGDKPKFPRPSEPAFVLWQAARAKDADGIRMVTHTCERMAAGGMYDQLGGGFSRYSVDEKWLVPHFEKMLYDNAQLIHLYLDAYLVSGDEQHAAVVRDILRYLARDMTHEDGGWYSAEDADSEGQEGKFYCWTKTELEKILNAEEAALITRHYGITEHGNFEDHSHPNPLKNLNVL